MTKPINPPQLGLPHGARASTKGTSCGAVGTVGSGADSGAEPVAPMAASVHVGGYGNLQEQWVIYNYTNICINLCLPMFYNFDFVVFMFNTVVYECL